MNQTSTRKRPKYLNLIAIRLPLPGFVSILHRVSGILLFLALPFLTWALAVGVESEAGYAQVAKVMAQPLIKLLLLGVIWSVVHHLCAGIRFLLLEIRIGIELAGSRLGALLVMLFSLPLTLLCAWWLLI